MVPATTFLVARLNFRVLNFGFSFWVSVSVFELRFRVSSFGSRASEAWSWFRVSGFGFRVSGFGGWVRVLMLGVQGLGFGVWGLGFIV